jgi:uncharacterized GH25 family protein
MPLLSPLLGVPMRLILKYTSLIFLGLSASSTYAHDFWLTANGFQNKTAPITVPVSFSIGHGDEVDPWTLNWDRIVALRAYSENGYSDQLSGIVANNALSQGFARISLDSVGTHVVGFESYHSLSTLASDQFNSYAEKEGLALVLAHRESKGLQTTPGREIYSRKAKTLIQVGNKFTENANKPIGHMLEIVPLENPYQLAKKDALPIQVLFRGKPLENAQVEFFPLAPQGPDAQRANASEKRLDEQVLLTNENGNATFNIVQSGNWMVHVIWSVPNPGNNSAEFETYFSSLTFGY